MKQLFLISHDTTTAVQIGVSITGIASLEPERIAAINAFLTINHLKNIIPVWDDDDQFEEILDAYTFITVEDANKSIYSRKMQ
ncbi:MAG: hypothetical protein H7Y13_04545 [Sphingobacteriaceae bacterium]|nr:hypothetical protein [Sphingobacteriaceae bacterium]